jgi:hypothetical protein
MFDPFFNKKAWKNIFSVLSLKLLFFAMPYSGINFQYIFHQFASHFFSIELELNLVEFKLNFNLQLELN